MTNRLTPFTTFSRVHFGIPLKAINVTMGPAQNLLNNNTQRYPKICRNFYTQVYIHRVNCIVPTTFTTIGDL